MCRGREQGKRETEFHFGSVELGVRAGKHGVNLDRQEYSHHFRNASC